MKKQAIIVLLVLVMANVVSANILGAGAGQFQIIDLHEEMGLLSDQYFEPLALNDHGQIVGTLWNPSDEQSILWDKTGVSATMYPAESMQQDINNNGQVAGHFGLWDNGVVTPLAGLGGSPGYGNGINNSGTIVGMSRNANADILACMWDSPGNVVNLGTFGGNYSTYSRALAINDLGQITGFSETNDGVGIHAFYYDVIHGMIDIGGLGGRSIGFDINIHGQITGVANQRAFIWEDLNSNGQSDTGEMFSLGTLGSGSYGQSINDNGHVVGYSSGRVFYYDELNGMVDLISLLPEDCGWERLEYASCINNLDQIIGYGITDQGEWHSFLVQPVPEPTTLEIAVDIQPGSCPNPLRVNFIGNGVYPVAVVGSADFDVTTINPDTVTLIGVAPLRGKVSDVSTPGDVCELGPDGIPDLVLKFRRTDIIAALEDLYGDLTIIPNREELFLTLLAETNEGEPVTGTDSLRVLNRGVRPKKK